MQSVVVSMTSALRTMHLPLLTATMDRFEKMNDYLNLRQTHMNQALDSSTSSAVGTDEVDLLMAQIVDRTGLEVRNEMPVVAAECSPSTSTTPASHVQLLESTENSTENTMELEENLARLRNRHYQ